MRRVAFLVGNSTFAPDAAIPNLLFPSADVQALADVLKDVGSFNRIESLVDADNHRILTKLSEVLHEERGALVFFYYSGHGKISDGGQLILAARNTTERHLSATGVPFTSIIALKNDFSCGRFCVVLDCCYAGLGSDHVKGSEDDQLKAVVSGKGIFFLGAANATTVAKEDGKLGHGVLTAAILEGLRTGQADADNDGRITGPDLFTWCKNFARSHNYHSPVHVTRADADDLIIGFSRRRLSHETTERVRAKLAMCWQHGLLEPAIVERLRSYFMTQEDIKVPAERTTAAYFLEFVDGKLRLDEFLRRMGNGGAAQPIRSSEPEPPSIHKSDATESAKNVRSFAIPALIGIVVLGLGALPFLFHHSAWDAVQPATPAIDFSGTTALPESWKTGVSDCTFFTHVLNSKGQGLAILIADDPRFDYKVQVFRQYAEHFGLKIVVDRRFPTDTSDFNSYVQEVARARPNRIIWCPNRGNFVRQAQEAGLTQ
jgi:hypothetical protein